VHVTGAQTHNSRVTVELLHGSAIVINLMNRTYIVCTLHECRKICLRSLGEILCEFR